MRRNVGIGLFAVALFFAGSNAGAETLPGLKRITPNALIGQIKDKADKLLGNAVNDGNILAGRMANELNVLAENIRIQFGDELDKKIGDIKDFGDELVASINELLVRCDALVPEAYNIADTLAIDLENIVSKMPGGKAADLSVRRINGLTIFKSPNHRYVLSITGRGLGSPNESIRSDVAVTIDGVVLSGLGHMVKPPYTSEVLLPAIVVEGLFHERAMSVVPMKISITYTITKKKLKLFKTVQVKQLDLPVSLVLVSDYAGTIIAKSRVQQKGWVLVNGGFSIEMTTGDHHCESDCGKQPTARTYPMEYRVRGGPVPVIGNMMIANPRIECIGGTCTHQGIDQPSVTQNGTVVSGAVTVWSRPARMRMTFDIYQYRVTGNHVLNSISYDMYFGQNFRVVVPSDNVGVSFIGWMVNNSRIDIEAGKADPFNRVSLVAVNGNSTNPTKEYVYFVKSPLEWKSSLGR